MFASTGLVVGLVGLVAGGVIAGLVIWFVRMRLRVGAAWKAFAAKHGFEHMPSNVGAPLLRGNYRNVPVMITTEWHSHGGERVYYTAVTAWLGTQLPMMLMSTERLDLLGGGPNETPLALKLPELKDHTIWSRDSAGAKALLTGPVRTMLQALLSQYPLVLVQGDQVKVEIPEVLANVPDMETMVDDVVRLTQLISKALRATAPRE